MTYRTSPVPQAACRRGSSPKSRICGRRGLASLVGLIALLFASAAQATAAGETRVALVIGNGSYGSLDKLPAAAADAKAVAEALRGLEFDVIELVDGSNGEMSAALQSFKQRLTPGAVAVFYYAGHAIQFQGRNFLLPESANLTSDFAVLTEGIVADTVLSVMEKSGASVKLMFLDAAHRNRFVEASQTLEAGLAPMATTAPGTIIVQAAEPGHVAADEAADGSAFANVLVENLSQPVIEVGALLAALRRDVATMTNGRQTPWLSAEHTTEEIFLRPTAAEAAMLQAEQVSEAPEPGVEAPGPEERGIEQAAIEKPEAEEPEAPEAQEPSAADDAVAGDDANAVMASDAPAMPEAQADTAEAPTDAEPGSAAPTPAQADEADARPKERPAGRQGIEDALSTEEKRRIQGRLAQTGFYQQAIDGVFGPATREAIRAYQQSEGAEATGWLTVAQIYRLLHVEPPQSNLNEDVGMSVQPATIDEPPAPDDDLAKQSTRPLGRNSTK